MAREDLRIVSDDLWNQVQARLAAASAAVTAKGGRIDQARRPKHLLSGVIVCDACGSAMSRSDGGPREARFRCNGRLTKGAAFCPVGRTALVGVVEERVVAAVRDRLLRPEAVEAAVREARRLIAEAGRSERDQRHVLERELGDVRRRLDRLVDQVADGQLAGATVGRKIADLETTAEALEQRLVAISGPDTVVDLHPAMAGHYRQLVDSLSTDLEGDSPAATAAREAFRQLIGQVRFRALEARGAYELEIVGELSSILRIAAGPDHALGEFRFTA